MQGRVAKPDRPDLRKLFIEHCRLEDAYRKEMETHPDRYTQFQPRPPSLPEELRGLNCGAKTRKGMPCQLTEIYDNGRCKWHGGLTTGPKTEAGKEQCRINGRKGGRPKKT